MLNILEFRVEYPAEMSQMQLVTIWAREADAALAAKKAGVVRHDRDLARADAEFRRKGVLSGRYSRDRCFSRHTLSAQSQIAVSIS